MKMRWSPDEGHMCGLCHGSCNLFWVQGGKPKWLLCPNCNGVGTRSCDSPPTIKMHWKKNGKLDQINRKLQFANNTTFGPIIPIKLTPCKPNENWITKS